MPNRNQDLVEDFLATTYYPFIDTSDARSEEEAQNLRKTRALVAFGASKYIDADPQRLSSCICDGFDDGGLDFVFPDEVSKTITIGQSKFVRPTNGIGLSDVGPFVEGVKHLLRQEFSALSAKLLPLHASISDLLSNPDTKVHMYLVTTSAQSLAPAIQSRINSFVNEQNLGAQFLSFEFNDLSSCFSHYRLLSSEVSPTLEGVLLSQFGQIVDPVEIWYGVVSANDVAQWAHLFGESLYSKNIRKVLEKSRINESIVDTALVEPEQFLYFNNGITMIATAINRAPQGGGSQHSVILRIHQASVVNGAQTVGSLYQAYLADPTPIQRAKVFMRIIVVGDDDQGLANSITKNTNSQNPIGSRDFVALDPGQHRLREQFGEIGKKYLFKSGETVKDSDSECDLDELTIALACNQQNIRYAVMAKTGLSRLWVDIRADPYTTLFNSTLDAQHCWDLVAILRDVDERLVRQSALMHFHSYKTIARHANRFILHLAFKRYGRRWNRLTARNRDTYITHILTELDAAYVGLCNENYPATVFKSPEKCRILEAALA